MITTVIGHWMGKESTVSHDDFSACPKCELTAPDESTKLRVDPVILALFQQWTGRSMTFLN
jgi:hypothetical protein